MMPKVLNIKALLSNDKYTIPLYQRNYAWGETEINQFLQDICDKFNGDEESSYYIGSLIVDNKSESCYEIIDGQQRHTTIMLINGVIREYAKDVSNESVAKSNLAFDARYDVGIFIEKLISDYAETKTINSENPSLTNFLNALKIIESFIADKKKNLDFEKYLKFFYENVKIVRIEVPKDTDINHYFEVMNNRGEQLEKHEILKARFIGDLHKSLEEKGKGIQDEMCKRFAMIWDACSQMDIPLQSYFKSIELSSVIFGNDFTEISNDIISKSISNSTEENKPETLSNILENYQNKLTSENNSIIQESRYKSIIDFPNFLLQVLKIEIEEVSLDDKRLLDEFGYSGKIKERAFPDSITFINKLFYYRALFDRFIIKREEGSKEWSWSILMPYKSNGILNYRNTFNIEKDANDDESVDQKEVIMIQSMLHVSFPSNNNKNWLQSVLRFFQVKIGKIDKVLFLKELETIAGGIYKESKFTSATKYPYISRFLFFYTDYILWSFYNRKVKGKVFLSKEENNGLLKIVFDSKQKFNEFRFTQSNSIEHVSPQTPADGSVKVISIDNFGNLCLISSSTNSRFSNLGFVGKKEHLNGTKQIESLKQVIIFSYDKWGDEEILEHEIEMFKILETLE